MAEDEIFNTETFGPIVGVSKFSDLERGNSASPTPPVTGFRRRSTPQTPKTPCASGERNGAGMLSVNNSTSGAEAHLPFGRQR